MAVKGDDPERWPAGMRRIVRQASAAGGQAAESGE